METNIVNIESFHHLSDGELQEVDGGWSPFSVAWNIGKAIAVSAYKHREDIANGWEKGWNSIK